MPQALLLFILTVLGMIDLSRLQYDTRTYTIEYDSPTWPEVAKAQCLTE